MKSTGTDVLSADNKAFVVILGNKWPTGFGGDNRLGPLDRETFAQLNPYVALSRAEFRGEIAPAGVTAVVPKDFWMFSRNRSTRSYQNGAREGTTGDNINDDSDSKFLDITPSPDGAIFDLDTPGARGVVPHTLESYTNFEQFVQMKNSCAGGAYRPCSTKLTWNYRMRIDFDKPANKVELNALTGGHIPFPGPDDLYRAR